jgi:hypothetical protein
MSAIVIQAQITGYDGRAVNLLGALDTDTGYIMVHEELRANERNETAIFVTNDPRAERDSLFTEEKLQEAIRLFFRAKASDLLELDESLSKHDPSHKIENDGVDERGSKYRLAPEITNGNVAVLAIMSAANGSYNAQAATDFSGEMAEMFLTI